MWKIIINKKKKIPTAEWYLPEEVNSSNEKKQADLDYKIIDLDEDKEYKSF